MKKVKESLTYNDYIKGIKTLKLEEQLSLVEIISARLKSSLRKKRVKNSILELEGLGSKIWKGIHAQSYVREERKSWK